MAKLNARGREEWLRLQHIGSRDGEGSIRTQRAYMSDNHILERTTFLKADGKVDFDDGWKDLGKSNVKFGTEGLAAIRKSRLAEGWTEVKPDVSAGHRLPR